MTTPAQRARALSRVRNLTAWMGERVPDKTLLAALAKGQTADQVAADIAALHPVARALQPAREQAALAARNAAANVVTAVRADLKAHGWNAATAAPLPTGHYGSPQYVAAATKRNLYARLTEKVTSDWRDTTVRMHGVKIGKFMEARERDALASYDAFIVKLTRKIGPDVATVTIDGSHVWDYSILTATFADGRVERWHTQQIINQTKYGEPYLQWPSRKLKR